MLTIAILAGGQSRRFGSDKALRFLPAVADAARASGLPVCIVGRSLGIPGIVDLPDPPALIGVGPLGGLHTALSAAQHPVLLIACDMPLLTPEALGWLAAAWESEPPQTLGLVAGDEAAGTLEPLFAVYRPELLARIDRRLAQGRRSLHGLIGEGGFRFVAPPSRVAACLANINTPEEAEALPPRPAA